MHINKKTILFILGLLVIIGVLVYGIYVYRNTRNQNFTSVPTHQERQVVLKTSCLSQPEAFWTACLYDSFNNKVVYKTDKDIPMPVDISDALLLKINLPKIIESSKSGELGTSDSFVLCIKTSALSGEKIDSASFTRDYELQSQGAHVFCTDSMNDSELKETDLLLTIPPSSADAEFGFQIYVLKNSDISENNILSKVSGGLEIFDSVFAKMKPVRFF